METTALKTIVINWLHLSAAMLWLGAVFTGATVLAGNNGTRGGATRDRLSAAFYRVFSPYAWFALAVLIVTGVIRTSGHLEGGVGDLFTTSWGKLLTLKLTLVLLMVAAGTYATYAIAPRLDSRPISAKEATRRTALEGRLRIVALFSALMGLGVLFIVTLL